jgi:hypothetical protein
LGSQPRRQNICDQSRSGKHGYQSCTRPIFKHEYYAFKDLGLQEKVLFWASSLTRLIWMRKSYQLWIFIQHGLYDALTDSEMSEGERSWGLATKSRSSVSEARQQIQMLIIDKST